MASQGKKLEGCTGPSCGGPNVCFVAGTWVTTGSGFVPIETLAVGDRVRTSDGRSETQVDASWQRIELVMPNPEAVQDLITVQLLRPPEWLSDRGATVGSQIPLGFEELQLAGDALITAVSAAPALASGEGRVVTATMTHLNNNLYRLHLNNGEEVLEPTGAHRFYSADRGAWVSAQELSENEHIVTADGTAEVSRIERVFGAAQVFNLEVESDHEYFVSELRVLSHNAGGCGDGAKQSLPALDSTGKVHGSLPKPGELGKHSADELRQLQTELRQSVRERIRKTVELGPDKAHGQRQGAEQDLIRQIAKHLEGK